jgi:hypothetical protein
MLEAAKVRWPSRVNRASARRLLAELAADCPVGESVLCTFT